MAVVESGLSDSKHKTSLNTIHDDTPHNDNAQMLFLTSFFGARPRRQKLNNFTIKWFSANAKTNHDFISQPFPATNDKQQQQLVWEIVFDVSLHYSATSMHGFTNRMMMAYCPEIYNSTGTAPSNCKQFPVLNWTTNPLRRTHPVNL